VIQLARKIVDLYHSKDPRCDHLDEAEVAKVEKAIQNSESWLNEARGFLMNLNEYDLPPQEYQFSGIRASRQEFEGIVNPIIHKPKPKVEPPPTNDVDTSGTSTEKEATADQNIPEATGESTAAPREEGGTMEVD
jgi:hypothetical protein